MNIKEKNGKSTGELALMPLCRTSEYNSIIYPQISSSVILEKKTFDVISMSQLSIFANMYLHN